MRYGELEAVRSVDLDVPGAALTCIVGPNGCGKSTLLRALARVRVPDVGEVMLDGLPIASYSTREVARRIALLPQVLHSPEGLTVKELVGRGRFPHRSLLRQWSGRDDEAVANALHLTRLEALADRHLDRLSGGQRQRAWLAMVLAQEAGVLLLDEPTTYLDVAHQVDVLELCVSLVHEVGRTVVVVMHDLNQAARFADHMVVMRDGTLTARGTPHEILTEELVGLAFDFPCRVIEDPESGMPMVVPRQGEGVRQRRNGQGWSGGADLSDHVPLAQPRTRPGTHLRDRG